MATAETPGPDTPEPLHNGSVSLPGALPAANTAGLAEAYNAIREQAIARAQAYTDTQADGADLASSYYQNLQKVITEKTASRQVSPLVGLIGNGIPALLQSLDIPSPDKDHELITEEPREWLPDMNYTVEGFVTEWLSQSLPSDIVKDLKKQGIDFKASELQDLREALGRAGLLPSTSLVRMENSREDRIYLSKVKQLHAYAKENCLSLESLLLRLLGEGRFYFDERAPNAAAELVSGTAAFIEQELTPDTPELIVAVSLHIGPVAVAATAINEHLASSPRSKRALMLCPHEKSLDPFRQYVQQITGRRHLYTAKELKKVEPAELAKRHRFVVDTARNVVGLPEHLHHFDYIAVFGNVTHSQDRILRRASNGLLLRLMSLGMVGEESIYQFAGQLPPSWEAADSIRYATESYFFRGKHLTEATMRHDFSQKDGPYLYDLIKPFGNYAKLCEAAGLPAPDGST